MSFLKKIMVLILVGWITISQADPAVYLPLHKYSKIKPMAQVLEYHRVGGRPEVYIIVTIIVATALLVSGSASVACGLDPVEEKKSIALVTTGSIFFVCGFSTIAGSIIYVVYKYRYQRR